MTVHIKEVGHDVFCKVVSDCMPGEIERREEEGRHISDGDTVTLRPGSFYNQTPYTMSTLTYNDDDVHEGLGTTPAYLMMLTEEICNQIISAFFDGDIEQQSAYCIRAQEK